MTPEEVPGELVQPAADVLQYHSYWTGWERQHAEDMARQMLAAALELHGHPAGYAVCFETPAEAEERIAELQAEWDRLMKGPDAHRVVWLGEPRSCDYPVGAAMPETPANGCAHCGKTDATSRAGINGAGVCHTPWKDGAPLGEQDDCYRLVTVYGEPLGSRMRGDGDA